MKSKGKLHWIAKQKYINGTLHLTSSGWRFEPTAKRIAQDSWIISDKMPWVNGNVLTWIDDDGIDNYTFAENKK